MSGGAGEGGGDGPGAGPANAQRGRVSPRWLLFAGLVPIAAAPLGWVVTDRLERNDDFCIACHLSSGEPLHAPKRSDFDARPPATLAALHGAERVGADDPHAFRCIDCHGGTGLAGRARVKVLAAKDALVYLTGRFDEPDGMAWPLRDDDCAKCHARFDEQPVEAWRSPRFHQLPVHNVELGVACVSCHGVHDAGGDPEHHFLRAAEVRSWCARCHSEYEEDSG